MQTNRASAFCKPVADIADRILAESGEDEVDAEAEDPVALERADPAILKQRLLDKNLARIQQVKQHLDAGTTSSPAFRNCLMRLLQGYYINAKTKLSENEITQIRDKIGVQIADTPGLLDGVCRLAYEAFDAERESRFLEPTGDLKKGPSNLLGYVVTLCQNFSDQSLTFARVLSRCNWALRLFSDMQRAWSQPHLAEQLHEIIDKHLRQSISVVYNLLFKGESEIFFNLLEFKFVETAEPYLQSRQEHHRFSAFLVLVFGCNEEEATKLFIREKSLASFLVANLKSAHKHSTRRSKGFHVIELATCALQFTKNEHNKSLLVECGILPVLCLMLQQIAVDKQDEVSAALKILLSLSFNSECAAAITEQCGPELRTLRRKAEWRGNRELDAIQFNFEGEFTADSFVVDEPPNITPAAPAPPPSSPPASGDPQPTQPAALPAALATQSTSRGHLMISYNQQSSSNFVRWICPKLVEQNFQVWVDYEDMEGSTLDCMAKAVEGSVAVLMCVTKGYKESDYCRMEAEYAVRRKKPIIPLLLEDKYRPDGWLGIIMGSKLYYSFTGKRDKDELEKLIKSLRGVVGDLVDGSRIPWPPRDPPSVRQSATVTTSAPPSSSNTQSYADWNSEQVARWIVENRLSSHLEPLRMEGRHLKYLVRMRGQAPEAFYRMLQKGLKLSMFHDVYDFEEALERL